MKQPNVSIYGSKNCADTTRAMRFLDEHEIPYEFKDVDLAPELNSYVANLNNGVRKMPVIQIDNEILINPADGELAKAVEQAAAERS
jgi:thioredoxin reductase (NADPH)